MSNIPWTAADEAQWQRFTKGIPDYGTDARNAALLRDPNIRKVFKAIECDILRVLPWVITVGLFVYSVARF